MTTFELQNKTAITAPQSTAIMPVHIFSGGNYLMRHITQANLFSNPLAIGNGTANTGKFTTLTATTALQAPTSAGLLIEAANGTDIGLLGVGNTANVTWYGNHSWGSGLSIRLNAGSGNEVLDVGGAVRSSGASASFSAGLEGGILDFSTGTAVRIGHVNGASGSAKDVRFISGGSTFWTLKTNGDMQVNTNFRGITDSSNNKVLNFEGAASAVNYWGVINSATGNRIQFYAAGSDTNISVDVQTKGTGTFRSLSIYNTTTASAANVFVNTSGELLRSTSSIEYKKDIEDLDLDIAKNVILNSRPVFYKSKCEKDNADWSYYGLIAEELEQLEPRVVVYGKPRKEVEKTDHEGNKYIQIEEDEEAELKPDGVFYERLVPMLIKVIQEQEKRIKALEAK